MQRAPLQRRTEDLQIAKYVGTRQVITGEQALNGAGAYWCSVCECHLRDSANYLAHINGRKHNRMLGMSMRAERSTLGEVRARLEAHKQRDSDGQELSKEEKAALFLETFDERMRQREEEMRLEAAEKRRLARQATKEGGLLSEEGSSNGAAAADPPTGAATDDDKQALVADADPPDEFAAMMGFGGFGGSKKQG